MDQNIGKLLDNRYELLELIGVGGMAKVYKARCHRLNRLVAVKILRDDLSQDSDFRRRFYDESQAVAMLSHPNIVAVYDVNRSDDLEYIVMELIDGISLKQYMQKKGNKLNWREALHFITQIVKGLGHAHSRGIIHRDIKPHNIMVLRDGSVKVADFGIARLASAGHSTLTQETLGSVHYISPEQARGSHIDARSDLYSAGVVLYEMLTGRLPFEGDSPVSVAIQHINSIPLSPRELNAEIPEALETITMKAMASSVDKRYESAAAMLADLEEFRKNPSINFDYTCEDLAPANETPSADSEKTRKVTVGAFAHTERTQQKGSGDQRVRRSGPKSAPRDDEEDDDRGEVWPIVVASAAILLFVGGLLYFLFGFIKPMFQTTPDYVIPNLVGQVYSEVAEDESLLGEFTVSVSESVTSEEPKGTIIKQSPDGDTKTKDPNTQILLTISNGPEIIIMTDVTGQEYHKALVTLQNMGLFVPVPSYAAHEEIPANHVISHTPLEGTEMRPGDRVDLVVSTGPSEKLEQVPLFIGQTEEWARNKIDLQNLKLGSVFQVWSSEYAAGVVVDQSIAAYTEVPQGTQINLQVSKGPDPSIQIPATKSKTISIDLPADSGQIRVSLKDGDTVIMERTVDTATNTTITFQVTGSGTKLYSIYFNDQFHASQSVDFDS
ncbi:MAG: Stk1 family PASTA domain-containing Ser/Thr kinase [Ruminococcaceae bacterium]|nr:Stk1 family PASTA domain-containing Ser/Thr kinase [Oscillospiraceae bacterium]